MTVRPLLLLSVALTAAPAHAVEITQCRQAVPPREVGELRADLHCTKVGLSAQGVFLERRATLNLNGFTITGDGTGFAVQCAACTINGPGEITNFDVAITGAGGRARIQNLVVRGNRNGMEYKAPRVIELINVVMSDNAEIGMSARGGRMRGRDIDVSRNGMTGIFAPIDKLVRLTAIGNGTYGGAYVLPPRPGRPARLVDSTITDNDGLGAGFDVLSTGAVRLVRTTCGRGARVRFTSDGGVETTTVVGRLGCARD